MCPAEADIAWWLATRKQMLEVDGIDADPELPGFDSRAAVVRRFEEMIGQRTRKLGLGRDFRDGPDGLLHSAHPGIAAQQRPGRPLSHPSTDSAGVDRRRDPRLVAGATGVCRDANGAITAVIAIDHRMVAEHRMVQR